MPFGSIESVSLNYGFLLGEEKKQFAFSTIPGYRGQQASEMTQFGPSGLGPGAEIYYLESRVEGRIILVIPAAEAVPPSNSKMG